MLYREKVKEQNPIVFQIIKNAYLNEKLSHAFLFSSLRNIQIKNEPLFLIQTLISENAFSSNDLRNVDSYADLITIDGSNNLISKEQVTIAINSLLQTPLEKEGKKILFIKNIENSNKQSLNSLLKFIEEPTPDTYIIMTTNNISQVIPTIKSRAYLINVLPPNFANKVEEFKQKGFPDLLAKIASSIQDSSEDNEFISSQELDKNVKQTISVLEEIMENKKKISYMLNDLINKDNYKLILSILRLFFNDVPRYQNQSPTIFENQNLFDLYKNFDFQRALMGIGIFLSNQEYNVNFDLSKTNLILELEASYG